MWSFYISFSLFSLLLNNKEFYSTHLVSIGCVLTSNSCFIKLNCCSASSNIWFSSSLSFCLSFELKTILLYSQLIY